MGLSELQSTQSKIIQMKQSNQITQSKLLENSNTQN